MITEIPADLNNLLENGAGQKFFDRNIIPWKPNDQEKTIEYHGYMIKEVDHYGGKDKDLLIGLSIHLQKMTKHSILALMVGTNHIVVRNTVTIV